MGLASESAVKALGVLQKIWIWLLALTQWLTTICNSLSAFLKNQIHTWVHMCVYAGKNTQTRKMFFFFNFKDVLTRKNQYSGKG